MKQHGWWIIQLLVFHFIMKAKLGANFWDEQTSYERNTSLIIGVKTFVVLKCSLKQTKKQWNDVRRKAQVYVHEQFTFFIYENDKLSVYGNIFPRHFSQSSVQTPRRCM